MKPAVFLMIFVLMGVIISLSTGSATIEPVSTVSGQLGTNTVSTVSGPTQDPVAGLVDFVREAVAYANEHGKESACREFSDIHGLFFREDRYIYAYDFEGITLAHPLQPELIGKSRSMEIDSAGDVIFRNLSRVARNGSGFVIFYYRNPAHNNMSEKKLGYVEKIDDTWWIGSGIYGENVTLPDEFTEISDQ